MKRLVTAAAVMTMAVACGSDSPTQPSNTGPIVFTVALSAANEVPAVSNAESNARGTATITFNVPRDSSGNITGGGSATFVAQLSGFPAGAVARAAHIHNAPAGSSGGIFVDTGLSAATAVTLAADGTGSLNLTQGSLTQDQAQQIVANPAGFYFNVHTNANPGGAVRGQLTRQ